MSMVEVLKFGSSVLRTAADLPVAVDEIYRHLRAGKRVLAVVSAFEGVTDQLLREIGETKVSGLSRETGVSGDTCAGGEVGSSGSSREIDVSSLATLNDPVRLECGEAIAAYVATGEQRTAALLLRELSRCGMPARIVEPREIGLRAHGSSLDSAPQSVDAAALDRLWFEYPILVLPGFYGISPSGTTALFGRGGSDVSALFLAAELGGSCRLVKDVSGVFEADPARFTARRFAALSWTTAAKVAGPLIQPKALSFAQSRALAFHVGGANGHAGTVVGHPADEWTVPTPTVKPLRIAIVGCGIVGRGVYEAVRRYPQRYEVAHVIVRDVAQYANIDGVSADASLALGMDVDAVIICCGGIETAHSLIAAALAAGKFVITANKAVIAAHGAALCSYARGAGRRLWYSAAVGGAVPVLERIAGCNAPVREIRGIVNGTCGVVLDAWESGVSRPAAIALAQSAGFAEADPSRDLSGRDSADKLALLIEAAFRRRVAPDDIPTRGIDTIAGAPSGHKLVARARLGCAGVEASIGPEVPCEDSFLGGARGPENRIEIELVTGEVIRLRGQGAGRWPTTVSVLGDLHEVARLRAGGGLELHNPP